MKLLINFTRRLASFFGSGPKKLNQSKLVGIYLSQTNSRDMYSAELQANRQRRNGKYSHNRERA